MARRRDITAWHDYEIRTGKDGQVGIYLRAYNVRLATFNSNTYALQTRLQKLFDDDRTTRLKRAAKVK